MNRLLLFTATMLLGFCSFSQRTTLKFTSSDTALQRAFDRAKQMALSHKGSDKDPVGPWYEAALPSRYAFCIRDVSHQCLGAEMLGMGRENKNMFGKFLQNISASKDWCTFWEINKWNRPAPADYKNDSAFWYNLNANFELIFACERLYRWTGDSNYIFSAKSDYFFEKSLNDYVQKWKLQPGSIFTRPAIVNKPSNFDYADNYTRSRGLPSYVESIDSLSMSADLVAAIYRGYASYASILKRRGAFLKSNEYEKRAAPYLQQLNTKWWNAANNEYFTFYTTDGKFGVGEGAAFLLWFDAVKDQLQKQAAIRQLLKQGLNIETMSYLPCILYKNGYDSLAKYYLLHISDARTPRREYPEASFGAIEGIVQGLMGIDADYDSNTVRSCYRGNENDKAGIDDLPVFNSTIKLVHNGKKQSIFTNKGNKAVQWQPCFAGRHNFIYVKGKRVKAQQMSDTAGNLFSFTYVKVEGKKSVVAVVK